MSPGTQQDPAPGPAGEQAGGYGDGLPWGCSGVCFWLPSSAGGLGQHRAWWGGGVVGCSRVPGAVLAAGSVPAVPTQPHRPHARLRTPARVSPIKDGAQPRHLSRPQPAAQRWAHPGTTSAPRARLGHPLPPPQLAGRRRQARSS